MKTSQIIQKVFVKRIQSAQIVNVVIVKMQAFNVVDDVCETGTYGVAAIVRILPVKKVKNNAFRHVVAKIALHHR